MARIHKICRLAVALTIVVVLGPGTVEAQTKKSQPSSSFNANVFANGRLGVSGATRLQIVISRWSTDEERAEILAAIQTEDERGIARKLASFEPVGYVREVSERAYDLRYARDTVENGKRVIILATDRPVEIGETAYNTRSSKHNVSIIELRLDGQDRGEGILAAGVRIRFDEKRNHIVLEDFTFAPLDLKNVRPGK